MALAIFFSVPPVPATAQEGKISFLFKAQFLPDGRIQVDVKESALIVAISSPMPYRSLKRP